MGMVEEWVEGLKAQMVKICKYLDDGVLQFKSVSVKLNVVVRDNGTFVQVWSTRIEPLYGEIERG